jgi:L-ascorbate metabolism protein UlaG (beta-lactamase superfamily)
MDDDSRAAGARRERILASPRFRDGAFRNTSPLTAGVASGHRAPLLREWMFGQAARRPPRPLPAEDPRPTWARSADGLRATWLGHSTVLLELDGMRVLTDPVWSVRISPFGPLGPRRFQPVPVGVEGLPPLDAIVISHDHFDHLDHGTILALTPLGVPFVTSLGVGAHLAAWGVPAAQIIELDWWEHATLRGGALRITAAPAQHFSGRVGRRDRTLWSSMVIASDRHRVFFSGDTGLTPEYAEIGARLGPFDLVMLEVGAFHPAWGSVHLGPANALTALRALGGGRLLPVHWGTFNLALHAWDEPAEVLIDLAGGAGAELVMPRLGAAVEPARGPVVEPWWRIEARREGALATVGGAE